ncbi:MAG: asparagine synthase (glutamine-hydrolyzing) [Sedimentisphaerales bacterium]|nr:asparagine synthase (glutamine-hydrolyzing) [Sedimentisphaerales bacterium]
MCGICGVYNFRGQPVDSSVLRQMNETLRHRGPDDCGYHVEGNVGLAHRRLSIIDLHTGKQPIYNEDKSAVIVYNGEVYNFLQLKDELEEKGHSFRTGTDTEVILHAYEQWGDGCVERFRGMFAFAIWDTRNKSLFLARDRLGIKPLYYFDDGNRFLFASELKAIVADVSVPKSMEIEALADFLSYGYVPAPKSIFRSIKKLPAGCCLVRDRNGLRIKQYWDLEFNVVHDCGNEDELCCQIISTLEESVRLRLVSDVPLGAFLSGGIDSSLVVALMSGCMQKPVITNTVGFTLEKYSEIEFAKRTSGYFNTDHHEFVVEPDAVAVVEKLSWFFDEPFADSSAIPTYYVSQMARRQVTVALSGDGGDENFAGYRRYYYDRLENRIRQLIPAFARKIFFGPLACMYPKADWLPQVLRAKTLLTNLSRSAEQGYFNSMSYFLSSLKRSVLSPDLLAALHDYDSCDVFREHYRRCTSDDPLTRTQYVDFKTYLVDDILTKVDRSSMANSLEVRVPIIDHKFVELVAGIPSSLKLKGRISKYLLKKAAVRLLPAEIMNRKKMGFSIPVGEWLKNELEPLVHETILSTDFNNREIFSAQVVKRLWEQHWKGLRDNTQPLWALLSFELWARRYM